MGQTHDTDRSIKPDTPPGPPSNADNAQPKKEPWHTGKREMIPRTFTLTPKQIAHIDKLAQEWELPKSEVLRRLIDYHYVFSNRFCDIETNLVSMQAKIDQLEKKVAKLPSQILHKA